MNHYYLLGCESIVSICTYMYVYSNKRNQCCPYLESNQYRIFRGKNDVKRKIDIVEVQCKLLFNCGYILVAIKEDD